MADPELASKLAKRLENIDIPEDDPPAPREPPPVPTLPQKVVPNPYVASDDSVSIDDLIAKTLKRNENDEENNNNVPSSTSPHPPSTIHENYKAEEFFQHNAQRTISPKSPPPKTTIGELLKKEQKPLSPPPLSRVPVVPIEHHHGKHEIKRLSPEEDGNELERKLAAQRAKKHYVPLTNQNNVIFSNTSDLAIPETSLESSVPKLAELVVGSSTGPSTQTSEPSAETSNEPVLPAVEPSEQPKSDSSITQEDEPAPHQNIVKSQADVHPENYSELPRKSPSPGIESKQALKSPPPPPPPPPSTLREALKRPVEGEPKELLKSTLDKDDLKSLMIEELKKNKTSIEEMIVLRGMKQNSSERTFSPTRELLELIHHENGVRSPPPPPPKPLSRPQSPAVTKKFSLDSTSSADHSTMFSERQNKPNPFMEKRSDSVDDELSSLLERRNKIMQGESVPEMIHKKLSLYAEFSEFSRKQIKFFMETFKKYDEDCDGFIDFDELKRMMEKLGEAQTHIALKEIIRRVDEDQDGKISLREFFLIFRLAAANELGCSEVFQTLADSVDVSKEGVLGAANFFQAKIEEQTKLSRFEQEMKEEQEERKRLEEEKKARREKFLQNKSIFQ